MLRRKERQHMDKLNIHDWHLGLYQTWHKEIIDFGNPNPDAILMADIALNLSNICRFGGGMRPFYSVAQHSCVVAAMAPKELKQVAMLHDATEAYLGDVVKPLKHIIGEKYAEIEDRFTEVIFRKYELDPADIAKVKIYDREAVAMEDGYRKGDGALCEFMMQQFGTSTFWEPKVAERWFKDLYTYHTKKFAISPFNKNS